MKIGIISDTHISQHNTAIAGQIQEDFKKMDMLIHAGDLCDLEVLQQLEKLCPNVRAVWGNMDPPEVKTRLPQKEIITALNRRIGVIHGWGHPDNLLRVISEEFRNDQVDIVIFGHSHQPFNEYRKGVLYFNPGSATDKVFAPYNSYGILEINDKIEARIVRI